MPIKSSFFPKEALQGQDIPSHVLWKDMDFDCIRINHSKNMLFKEVYNASKPNFVVHETSVIINKIDVEGYLGIIFSSKYLPSKDQEDFIEYIFLKNFEIIEKLEFKVHLFRQDIKLKDIPKKILINPIGGKADPKICVRNLGQGTAIIEVNTIEESKIQKARPKFVDDFIESSLENIESGISRLRESFAEFDKLLSKVELYVKQPVEFNKDSLISYNDFQNEFKEAVEKDDKFARALVDFFVGVILNGNMSSNIYQFLLEYMDSIGKEKIIIRDPFSTINVAEGLQKIRLEIKSVDLLHNICDVIELPSIDLEARQAGEIPLFKLFQWGGNEE